MATTRSIRTGPMTCPQCAGDGEIARYLSDGRMVLVCYFCGHQWAKKES